MELDRWLTDFARRFLQGEGALGWALEHWIPIAVLAILLGIAADWMAWALRFPRGRRARALLMRAIGHDADPGRPSKPARKPAEPPGKTRAIPREPIEQPRELPPDPRAPSREPPAAPRGLPDLKQYRASGDDAHLITEAMRADSIGDAVPFVPQNLRRPPAVSPAPRPEPVRPPPPARPAPARVQPPPAELLEPLTRLRPPPEPITRPRPASVPSPGPIPPREPSPARARLAPVKLPAALARKLRARGSAGRTTG